MISRPAWTYGSWPVLALAFGALLILIIVAALILQRKTNSLHEEMRRIQSEQQRREKPLNQLRSETYNMAILVRDYLLDTSRLAADQQRRQLLNLQESTIKHLDEVEQQLSPQDRRSVKELRQELEEYGKSLSQILRWTPSERVSFSGLFLRQRVIPFRETVFAMVRRIEELNEYNLRLEQEAISRSQREFRQFLVYMLAATVCLGFLIAGASIWRMARLESEAAKLQNQTEIDRRELRVLSQRLVMAQEEERKSISRELHDQIGQMLTAIQMEFANLGTLRNVPNDEFQKHLREAKALAESTLFAVRHMAMGLRPSMLDDLGLGPALEWQGREFSRRSGIPVQMDLDGQINDLPERVRTCVYRVVQEALTNCARHAAPSTIKITVRGQRDALFLTVQDDGRGFSPGHLGNSGVGLIGMEERVKELGGETSIVSQPGQGTLLRIEIPTVEEVAT
ncbi:MAG TPA: ATP-binding protein [Bryobacteraceae bacterium]|nr:ATP-binding protein [Bryobacteraceae bacterium]